MSVIDAAVSYVKGILYIKNTDYDREQLINYIHAETGICITPEESSFLLMQILKRKEKNRQ